MLRALHGTVIAVLVPLKGLGSPVDRRQTEKELLTHKSEKSQPQELL